jgi:tight adherence protein C
VLQDSQLADAQQKLAQAGKRNKEWAVAVILGRMVLPILFGAVAAVVIYWINYFPEWSDFKKFMGFAVAVGLGYKGQTSICKTRSPSAPTKSARACPMRWTCW